MDRHVLLQCMDSHVLEGASMPQKHSTMDAHDDEYASDVEAEPEEPSEGDSPEDEGKGAEMLALGESAEASKSSPADAASAGAP